MDILIKQLIIVRLMADKVDIFVRAGMRVYAGRSVSRCAAGWIFFILIYFKIPRIINAGKNSVGRIFADNVYILIPIFALFFNENNVFICISSLCVSTNPACEKSYFSH